MLHTRTLSRCRLTCADPHSTLHVLRCRQTGVLRTVRVVCPEGSGLQHEAIEAYICPMHAAATASPLHTVQNFDWHQAICSSDAQELPIVVVVGGKCDPVDGEALWDIFVMERVPGACKAFGLQAKEADGSPGST